MPDKYKIEQKRHIFYLNAIASRNERLSAYYKLLLILDTQQ